MPKQALKLTMWNYLQPVLVALTPLSVIVSTNIEKTKPAWILRPFLLITLFALSLAFICQRLFRNPQLGMVMASLIAVLFLYSGQLFTAINKFSNRFGPISGELPIEQLRQQLICGLTLAIQILLLLMLSQGLKQRPRAVEKWLAILNIFTLTIFIGSFIRIIGTRLASEEITVNPTGISADDVDALSPPDPLPDIYYLVLDSYPGMESLQQEFDYNNAGFLGYLEYRGFLVNNDALSNYYRSTFSIASTLNMDYIHDLAGRSEVEKLDGFGLSRSVRQSAIRRILSQFGYQTVAFSSGFFYSDVYDADVYYSVDGSGMNPLENSMLPWTLYSYLVPFLDSEAHSIYAPTYTSHIHRIDQTLDTLSNLGTLGTADAPLFVIAHILSPHPPFVFDSNGEITLPQRPFGLDDAGAFPGSLDEYREGFAGQTAFLNERLKGIIESLLTTSPRPTILILQGDHGTRWKCNMETAICEDMRIAFSILNARYLPGVDASEIEAALSPVNTFRMILNAYFDGQIPYLPDDSFISIGDELVVEDMEWVEFPKGD